jgi:hypothetical protein
VKKLTEEEWEVLSKRFGDFHDAVLIELRLLPEDGVSPRVEFVFWAEEWIDFHAHKTAEHRVRFKLTGISEFSFSAIGEEIAMCSIIDAMGALWHDDMIWIDFYKPWDGKPEAYEIERITKEVHQSPYHFIGKELFYELQPWVRDR